MPRTSNIRWRPSDEQKLIREVQKFNAKITRELKKNPESIEYLPERLSTKQLKKDITTRQDFNKFINKSERFMRKEAVQPITNKQGLTVTKWAKQEMSIATATINRNRAVERVRAGNMDAFTHGIPTGYKRSLMGDERTDELKPKKFNFDKIRNKNEWNEFVKAAEKQSKYSYSVEKMERFKANYFKGMQTVFGDRAKYLIEMLKNVDARKIIDTFYSDEQASIDFIYDEAEADAKFDAIMELWENALDG